ncbi:MAG: isoprenylcysteine carboxylmethyltransferase family protein [Planctomycetales bacterium]|nr:isoprenylcysteine carboxylmethyltransferase family protein [Planctomycetales bacterium]
MTQAVAIGVWALGIVVWCVIRYPYQRRARKFKIAAHKRSLEERLLLGGTTLGLVGVPLLWLTTGWPAGLNYEFQPGLAVLGMVCLAAFLSLFHAVHRQLGRNWSITLEIREDHALITEGLFKRIRHPMYSSFWLWALAQALLLPNWLAGFAGLVSVAALYFGRVYREEAMMRETFGLEYDAYMGRTKRIIPWVL